MTARRLPVALLGALLAVCVSACGGGSSAAGPASAGGASSSAATAAVTNSAAGHTGDVRGFCAAVKQQATLLTGGDLSALLTGGNAAAWKAYFAKVAQMNQQLVDTAPADIQPTVKTLQAASLAMQDVVAAAGYDTSKVGSAKLMQVLQSKERLAATKTLVAYVQSKCAIDLTKLPG